MRPSSKRSAIATSVLAAITAGILHWESSNQKHEMPFRDIAGNWTVCDGHTGPDVKPGVAWSEAQCADQRVKDIQREAGYVLDVVHVTMTGGQQVGIFDLAYNSGGKNVANSHIPYYLNAHQPEKACAVIRTFTLVPIPEGEARRRRIPIVKASRRPGYVYIDCRAAGHLCPGIPKRRDWEYAKCMGE